jgi:transposase
VALKMKPYSMDLRERIISAVEQGDSSIRKIAQRFSVSKNTVERLIARKRRQGNVIADKQGGSLSVVEPYYDQLREIVAQHCDATLAEYCELLYDQTSVWVSPSAMCRILQRLNLPRKKNATRQPGQKRPGATVAGGLLATSEASRTGGFSVP